MKGFRRPPTRDLPPGALVPDSNQEEPPEKFTHEVSVRQPFYFGRTTGEPSGYFDIGTPLTFVRTHGEFSTVLDRHGMRVHTPAAGLRKI